MTDERVDHRYQYHLRVVIQDRRIFVTGDGFHQLEDLGIDINQLWIDGFRGTIEVKGDMQ